MIQSKNMLLTVKEVAEISKVTTRTVYDWIWSKKLNTHKMNTGRIRISLEDLASFLDIPIENLYENYKITNKAMAE